MYDDLVKTFTANGYVDEETQRNDLAILKLVAEVNEVVPLEKAYDFSFARQGGRTAEQTRLEAVRRLRAMSTRLVIVHTLFLLLGAMPVVAFAQFSLAASREQLTEGARKDGELILYASMNLEEANAMISRFEQKYPFVKVKVERMLSVGRELIAEGAHAIIPLEDVSSPM